MYIHSDIRIVESEAKTYIATVCAAFGIGGWNGTGKQCVGELHRESEQKVYNIYCIITISAVHSREHY